jgi:signal peptidase I
MGSKRSKYSANGTRSAGRLRRLQKKTKQKHEARSWILCIAIAVAVALLFRAFVFSIVLVDGESMYPTLYSHERVAIEKVSRYFNLPEYGDIIIVKYPYMEDTYVKRAMGLPGDTLEIRGSIVYRNGEQLVEAYVNSEPYPDWGPYTVPGDHVFVMGDNRAHSLDSRAEVIGAIAKNQIEGHALFVIWPLTDIHIVN